jgi:hypothetical protein
MSDVANVRFRPPFEFRELNRSHPMRYHQLSVWTCLSGLTGRHATISGPLAQVLERHPDRFGLALVAVPCFNKRRRPL